MFYTQKNITQNYTIPERIPLAKVYNTMPKHVPHAEKYNTKFKNTRVHKSKIVSNKRKIKTKESKIGIIQHKMN